MGRRGPRPVDIELLRTYAGMWLLELFLLRNGRPGKIVRSRHGETKPIVIADVIPADKSAQSVLPTLKELRGKEGILWLESPVFPQPQIWEQLKGARSTAEIQKIFVRLEKHIRKRWHPPDDIFLPRQPLWTDTLWSKLLSAAQERADQLCRAKTDLLHYPKRKSSDDKRIVFFAKVLAGLALKRRPGYAIKRLSHWDPPIPRFSAQPTERKAKP